MKDKVCESESDLIKKMEAMEESLCFFEKENEHLKAEMKVINQVVEFWRDKAFEHERIWAANASLETALNGEREIIKKSKSELKDVTENRNRIMNSLLSCREELEELKHAHDFLCSEHCALENKMKMLNDDLRTLSESPCENHQGWWFSHHMSYGWDCKCKTCNIARKIIFSK